MSYNSPIEVELEEGTYIMNAHDFEVLAICAIRKLIHARFDSKHGQESRAALKVWMNKLRAVRAAAAY